MTFVILFDVETFLMLTELLFVYILFRNFSFGLFKENLLIGE